MKEFLTYRLRSRRPTRESSRGEAVGLGDFRFLFAFEAAVVELQGAAVFVDDADDFVGGAGGDVGMCLDSVVCPPSSRVSRVPEVPKRGPGTGFPG